MKRDLSLEEERDALVADLTEKHRKTLRAKLLACEGETILDVAGRVAVDLTDDVLNQLVVVAAMNPAEAGAKLAAMVSNALLAGAEIAALREVEQLEKQRKQSQDENRIARAELARALDE
jgi:hypothetical protein